MSKAETTVHDHTDGTRVTMVAWPVGVPEPECGIRAPVPTWDRENWNSKGEWIGPVRKIIVKILGGDQVIYPESPEVKK